MQGDGCFSGECDYVLWRECVCGGESDGVGRVGCTEGEGVGGVGVFGGTAALGGGGGGGG